MSLHTKVCLVVVGTFLASLLVQNECRKLDGYKFPVYSAAFCPRNETEWAERSSALNCNKSNGYMCLPNENFDELLQFCYIVPVEIIQRGICLYLVKRPSRTYGYSCSHFTQGCLNRTFYSNEIYKHPSCISLGNGCFLAEPSCKSTTPSYLQNTTQNFENVSVNDWNWSTTTHSQQSSEHTQLDNAPINGNDALFAPILLGIFIPVLFLSLMCSYLIQRKLNGEEENESLLIEENHNDKESKLERDIFDQWKQDDFCFISTTACEEVEKELNNKNLVIVAGHSGSGKSAIIQHIALKYREQGWTIKRVKKVQDIVDEYSSSRFERNKTFCVFHDPLGKESFDEILNNSWQIYEEELKLYLQKAKIVMSCRNYIISDTRVTCYLMNQAHIVNIDDNKNKLSVNEKRQILAKYTSNITLSDEDCDEIVKVEKYFPLLCKLYSSKKEFKNKGIGFFTEPVTVLEKEIKGFRNKDKRKYCVLALLVFFNDSLCISDLFKDKVTENKFKHTLKLCGLSQRTAPSAIGDNLNSLKDFFVKKVGDTYHFYHDFVMEVTTHMLGRDYPAETIRYADIGFLRRRVKLGNCEEHSDSFTIYLSDRYKEELGERLFTELFEERVLDVVLNPCLRNEKIIEVLKEKIAKIENLQMLLKTKQLPIDKQDLDQAFKDLVVSKLSFLELENEVSPLIALIVFCHTQLARYCVNTLQQQKIDFIGCVPMSAVCCNDSKELFNDVFEDYGKESLEKEMECLYPIHIVSLFHNYKLLPKLIELGVNVNQTIDGIADFTPLMLAVGSDSKECGNYYHEESGATRRKETVKLLLSNGADINVCTDARASPLYMACENGYDSTVNVLLSNGAKINLSTKDETSPLLIACFGGHISTVQLLLNNGADINLCNNKGASPLLIACQNGYYSIVQLLLRKGADINSCYENRASPLYIACQNGYESIVQRLLSNGADINSCDKKGASPYFIACQEGHDITVQPLLNNVADINLCTEDETSPLYIACQNGHDSIVQLLLGNGADINLCKKNKASPLYTACLNGHSNIVQFLLSNGADINSRTVDGASPLYIACFNGHDSTVQLLLSNRADINLCNQRGASPLYIASFYGHDSTVQLLLSNGADINLCTKNGASPLNIACQNGHYRTVQLLLRNRADINLCNKNKASPLLIACQNGHHSTVQDLLRNGAAINSCYDDGTSPLFIACRNGHDSTVHLLLRNRADINLCNKTGASPLYTACYNGHDITVQHLLGNGADINLCNKIRASPLFVACFGGHDIIIQRLLSNGADINLCTEDGTSPLFIACQNGHDSTVQVLLRNRADINLCNKKGTSPLDIARQNGHDSTVQLLMEQTLFK